MYRREPHSHNRDTIASLLQGLAMELAGRAISEAYPAGCDQIHLYSHQLAPVQVFEHRPGHLDDIALCLMTCNACGCRVPRIVRWTAARPTQPSQARAEPVADTDIDVVGTTLAAKTVNTLFPRDQSMLRRGIQVMPRRPRKVSPMRTLRISMVLPFHHLRIFLLYDRCDKGPPRMACLGRPHMPR